MLEVPPTPTEAWASRSCRETAMNTLVPSVRLPGHLLLCRLPRSGHGCARRLQGAPRRYGAPRLCAHHHGARRGGLRGVRQSRAGARRRDRGVRRRHGTTTRHPAPAAQDPEMAAHLEKVDTGLRSGVSVFLLGLNATRAREKAKGKRKEKARTRAKEKKKGKKKVRARRNPRDTKKVKSKGKARRKERERTRAKTVQGTRARGKATSLSTTRPWTR